MIKTNLVTLFIILIFGGCVKSKIAKDTPNCIVDKIKVLKKSDCAIEGESKVGEYIFQNETVYAILGNNCWMQNEVDIYDAECNFLGTIGGVVGHNRIINNEDFNNAIFVKSIWEK